MNFFKKRSKTDLHDQEMQQLRNEHAQRMAMFAEAIKESAEALKRAQKIISYGSTQRMYP